jgi:hypothetical protein
LEKNVLRVWFRFRFRFGFEKGLGLDGILDVKDVELTCWRRGKRGFELVLGSLK